MKSRIIFIIAIVIACSGLMYAQDPVTSVLQQIRQNNLSIHKFNQYTEAEIMSVRTDLYPRNPSFGMDYLWGNDPGTYLREITVGQEFKFPTVYSNKSRISEVRQEMFRYRREAYVWEVLFEAQQLCIHLVNLYKLEAEHTQRNTDAGNMLNDQQRRLDEGYSTALELDKAQLHRSLTSNRLQKIRSQIRTKIEHLKKLNGGRDINFESLEYPVFSTLPPLDSLFAKLEAVDPVNKMIEMQIEASGLEVNLAKAASLPEFEVGYRYEQETINKFNGVQFGVSIPLWEDKNKVKYSQLREDYLRAKIAEHETAHYYEIKETYQSLLSIEERMTDLRNALNGLKFRDNLKKALAEGEISRIDFYREFAYMYNIKDSYLEAEAEYHRLIGKLFKYKLLNLIR